MIIDGIEFGYHFPLGVLRAFEKRTKVKVFALSDPSVLSAEASAYLVFYGMRAWAKREGEEFNYSFEELLDMVGLNDVKEALECLMPDASDEEKKREL